MNGKCVDSGYCQNPPPGVTKKLLMNIRQDSEDSPQTITEFKDYDTVKQRFIEICVSFTNKNYACKHISIPVC